MKRMTLEQVEALERADEEHVGSCDECRAAINSVDPATGEGLPYCPVGESMVENSAHARLEWSRRSGRAGRATYAA